MWEGLPIRNFPSAAMVVAGIIVYLLIVNPLGFLLATFLMLVLLFSIWKKQRVMVVLGASVLITVLSYLLFDPLLKITLPTGVLGF